MRKLFLILIALGSFIPSARAQSAKEVLAKVSSVYAGCRSYSDEGSSNTESSGTGGRRAYFRTSFVRAGGFRYQLWYNSDKPGRVPPWVVWKSGDIVRSQGMFFTTGAQNLRLDAALGRMAAFSVGTSVVVPQLLLPDAFRVAQFFSLIEDARITGEEKIDGRHALRIEGTISEMPIKLWIDKAQFLLLKSYRKVNVGDRHEESTVQYKPKLNGSIPPEDLILPQAPNQPGPDTDNSAITRLPPNNSGIPPRLRNFGSSLGDVQQASGPAAGSSADEDVVRVETNLVVCAVLVLDAEGKIVRGLTTEDFIVKEDDQPQEVATFSLGDSKDLPRSIVLVIDYSGSQLPYIKTSIESAKTLVDKLNPKDRMAVVTDDVKLLVDFTSDKQLLKTRLEVLKASALSGLIGASDQYDALLASLNELFNNEDVRPIIIFQTDGDQLESLKGSGVKNSDPYWLPRKYSLEDILTATEKRRATVYSVISGIRFAGAPDSDLTLRAKTDWINRQRANIDLLRARNFPVPKGAFNSPPEEFFANYAQQWERRQTVLMGLAKFTGTVPEFLEEPSQADEIYTRVLTDIDRRYVVGYYPTNREHDGKRRKVSIEVRGHPEYTVWGQKSYFARKEE